MQTIKKGNRQRAPGTVLLRARSTLTVDDAWRGSPEAGVAGVLKWQGHKVYYTENTLSTRLSVYSSEP